MAVTIDFHWRSLWTTKEGFTDSLNFPSPNQISQTHLRIDGLLHNPVVEGCDVTKRFYIQTCHILVIIFILQFQFTFSIIPHHYLDWNF